MLGAGFVALSDDDFSRVVIAERFASHPALDPSGTSWLPLPFWVLGTAMIALGRSLFVARGVALVAGVVAALLVHRAARLAGASRPGALLGAAAATVIPTAARLGVSFQPEALTAGLVVLGSATAALDGSWRLAGAAALAAACLSRYEAWPAAAAFALLAAVDALRTRPPLPVDSVRTPPPSSARPPVSSARLRRTDSVRAPRPSSRALLSGAAALALAAPLAWVLHGAVDHRDALFFVHRVTAYRHALGVSEPWTASLLAYPAALALEPEVLLAFLVVLWTARRERARLAPLARPFLVLGAVLAFLVAGRLLDGAPTHHDSRTLLPIWTALALVAAEGTTRAFADRARLAPGALLVLALLAALCIALRVARDPESLSARRDERAIGDQARAAVPPGARLMVDTPDYGYFAVLAAFGAPERAEPFDRHDPRERRAEDAFASTAALKQRLSRSRASWLVVANEHLAQASELGRVVARVPGFALAHVEGTERGGNVTDGAVLR